MKDLPSELQAGLKLAAPPQKSGLQRCAHFKASLYRSFRLAPWRTLGNRKHQKVFAAFTAASGYLHRVNKRKHRNSFEKGRRAGRDCIACSAGMIRLGLENQITQYLDPLVIVPSPAKEFLVSNTALMMKKSPNCLQFSATRKRQWRQPPNGAFSCAPGQAATLP